MIDHLRCVVLNSTYEPLCMITVKKALVLYLEGKAVIVEEHPQHKIRSIRESFPAPTRIALKRYISRRLFATLTRKNLMVRDNHTCQYCLRPKADLHEHEFLTRDHVVPESKGGKSTWINLVVSCSSCNNKKGDKTLSEIGMTLTKPPAIPSIMELWGNRITLN